MVTSALLLVPLHVGAAEIGSEDRELLEAILAEDDGRFERALADGADVNALIGKWDNEWSMCAATQPGKERFLSALLDHGANPDLENPEDSSVNLPAVCSMVHGNIDAFDRLIEAGADPNLTSSGNSSLYLTALQLGNFDIGLRLLELTEPSYDDMLRTKRMIERTTTLQSERTRALAEHVRARGIPVTLPPADD